MYSGTIAMGDCTGSFLEYTGTLTPSRGNPFTRTIRPPSRTASSYAARAATYHLSAAPGTSPKPNLFQPNICLKVKRLLPVVRPPLFLFRSYYLCRRTPYSKYRRCQQGTQRRHRATLFSDRGRWVYLRQKGQGNLPKSPAR